MDRVQKLIAHAGICSRRKAEELIQQGLVKVNGETVQIGATASAADTIEVLGQKIKPEKLVYYMLHKPKGYITTSSDPFNRLHVLHLLHDDRRVFPVGRLDKDTSGLLLLTNDGNFANAVMHPRYEVEKTYEALLDKKIADDILRKINDGVTIDKKRIQAKAKRLSGKRVQLTVHTGLNKEVKKIFKKFGYWVKELKRTHIGSVKLNIREGKHRKLTPSEIDHLQRSA